MTKAIIRSNKFGDELRFDVRRKIVFITAVIDGTAQEFVEKKETLKDILK